MLERMTDPQFMLYVLAGISCIVLLQKIIVSLIYRHLKKQTDNLPNANGRWVRQIKQRFEAAYRVSKEETNVEMFVDRQVANMRFFKIYLHGMEVFYRKAQLICILLGGSSYILAARAGRTNTVCNEFFLMGCMAAIFLQLLDNLSGNVRSEQTIRRNLQDYLENMLRPKLRQGEHADHYMTGASVAAGGNVFPKETEHREAENTFGKGMLSGRKSRERSGTFAGMSGEEEERIVQDVLKEYLT